jgi:segregation and condensation protein A
MTEGRDTYEDRAPDDGELILALDGFEGPIGMLLALAREQKVDLKCISILALAEQYLAFILEAHRLRLELAADYLVMAAWLAYLKSRLLLPDPPADDEPSGAELASVLQFRLERLAAMQDVGQALLGRPQLGRDVFARGAPEGLAATRRFAFAVSLRDLLGAYGALMVRDETPVLHVSPPVFYSVDDAIERLSQLIGRSVEWRHLESFLPPQWRQGSLGRSALAATFAASLELAKMGKVDLRQERSFGPILLRRAPERRG